MSMVANSQRLPYTTLMVPLLTPSFRPTLKVLVIVLSGCVFVMCCYQRIWVTMIVLVVGQSI